MDCDSLEESLVSSISLFFCFFSFLNTEFFNGFAGLGFGVPFLEFAFLILLSSNNYLSKEEKKKKKKKNINILYKKKKKKKNIKKKQKINQFFFFLIFYKYIKLIFLNLYILIYIF